MLSNDCSLSKTISVCMKSRSPPTRMLLESFRTVRYPLMNGVLSAFCNFDSWTAKMSIWELISISQSSRNYGQRPPAFHWLVVSLFWKVTSWGWEGVEWVDPESWQVLYAARQFCWSLIHLLYFHWFCESTFSDQCYISDGNPYYIHCISLGHC